MAAVAVVLSAGRLENSSTGTTLATADSTVAGRGVADFSTAGRGVADFSIVGRGLAGLMAAVRGADSMADITFEERRIADIDRTNRTDRTYLSYFF
jgi:hypothetical protein